MAEYNINKITLPSGDVCNLQDSHGLATLSNSGIVDCSGDSQSVYGRKVFVSIPTLSETVGIQTGKTTDTHTIPSAAIYFRDSEIPTSEDSALGRPAASVINLRPAVGSSVGNQLGFDVYHPNSAGTSYDGSADRFLLPAATTGSTSDSEYNIFTSKGINNRVMIYGEDGSNGHYLAFGIQGPDTEMASIYGARASANNIYHISRLLFAVNSYNSSTGATLSNMEIYRLGTAVGAGLTSNAEYDIHTSKQSGPATTTTVTSGVVTRSSGATLVSQSVSQWGKVVTLCFTVKTTATVAAGDNVFAGTVASGYRPASKAIGGSYYGASGMFCVVDTNGSLTVRNIAASQSANSESGVSITYVIP